PRLARYPAGPAGRPGVGRLQYSAGRRPACRPQGGPRRVRAAGRRDRTPARGSEEGKADGATSRAQPGTQARRGGPCRGDCPFVKNEKTMKKLTPNDPETRSPDGVAENIQRLKALFPELVTEGPNGAAVNVDVLKALVGDATVTDADEKYGLNWHGK